MAKTSKVARNLQRQEVVARYADVRRELKRASVDPARPAAEREAAMRALHRLPRDASPTRVRNRDVTDGRPRGYYRKFGLSRVSLRERALRGELPGVTKSSW
ncbi:30S ribosomal protein S14 [Serinibacter arcticus]|uniref:Small ribosomal subunit protein uS14 n=1 Tax=Serinibacter arcticus TaxID=1655435 RepID=A0A2U1ZWT3_9MICO|nr:30S ribosomal protein S14 [Serinibacter arcticus]PWD51424.1 30S ribosomal protein S14 [Serinibacter arcticus]